MEPGAVDLHPTPGICEGRSEDPGDLGFDKEQAALLGFAFLVAYGIFQVPCGLIGDRFGARNVLTGLVIGWSLVTGLSTLALQLAGLPTGAFSALLAMRFLFGSFQ